MTLKSWAIQRSSISSRTFYEIEALVPNCYDHGGTCGASYSLCLQNECPVPCLLILIRQVASIGLSTNGAAEKPNTSQLSWPQKQQRLQKLVPALPSSKTHILASDWSSLNPTSEWDPHGSRIHMGV